MKIKYGKSRAFAVIFYWVFWLAGHDFHFYERGDRFGRGTETMEVRGLRD